MRIGLRLAGLGAAVALVATAVGVSPANADTSPPSTSIPKTVSTDVLPTVQIDGVVWAQVVIGSTVYVGGSFSTARPAGAAAGTSTVRRANMLAYNLTSGALLSGFAPTFNGQVRTLAASPDGTRVYAGGDFTTVNGATHNRLVALNAGTGSVASGFPANVNGSVYSVKATGSQVFLGGTFGTVNGVARTRAAAVSSSGAVQGFAPRVPDYAVRALVVSPDAGKVVLGGDFSSLNGATSPGAGNGMVDAATGRTNQPWAVGRLVYNHGSGSAIWSLNADSTNVYATGYVYGGTGNLEGTYSASWSGGTIRWIEDCHGDSYAAFPFQGAVYVASHAHFCGNIGGFPEVSPRRYQRGTAFTTGATGTVKTNTISGYYNFGGQPAPTLLTWYPDFNTGTYTGISQGPWTVSASGNYVLYGGEFTTVNGKGQQGLVRFAVPSVAPNKDGPRVSGSGWVPTATALSPGAKISWQANYDRDNQQLTYALYRTTSSTPVYTTKVGSRIWYDRPTVSYSDTTASGSVSYYVTATDPFGNTARSATVTVTAG